MGKLGDQQAKLASAEITLAALRQWADRAYAMHTRPQAGGPRTAGFLWAIKEVREILDSRENP